eukprot:8866321-Pyramimonas_sp.AAC.1
MAPQEPGQAWSSWAACSSRRPASAPARSSPPRPSVRRALQVGRVPRQADSRRHTDRKASDAQA